jgi:hypothetical protein
VTIWTQTKIRLPATEEPVWLFEKGRVFIGLRVEVFEEDGPWVEGWRWAECYVFWDGEKWIVDAVFSTDPNPTHWAPLTPSAPE